MNGQSSGIAGFLFITALIGAAALAAAAAVYAVVAFVALLVSIICLFAWDRTIVLFGNVFEPRAARAFIYRGLIGAGLAFYFAVFASLLFGVRVPSSWIIYILIGGYLAGSVGLEYLKAKQAQDAFDNAKLVPSLPASSAPEQRPAHRSNEEPFRFATWDDEIELDAPRDTDRCGSCAFNGEGSRPIPGRSLR
ncbi:hypothetical protein ACFQ4O_07480 [Methylopila musalis]|uniref:Uncharacterized protein n=1 Tax=Methylopila musalis TaxID=1134781 RepID=A0ABW3Z6F0_9HYPH